jgi:large subunit ribosomal protein L1
MSKTTQENKAKKAKQVEEIVKLDESQKADIDSEATDTEVSENSEAETTESASGGKTVRIAKVRGKKYQAAKKKVDVTKYYLLAEAIELMKKTSFSKFEGKVEAHVTIYDLGNVGEITFPHIEASDKKVVILNDAVLAEIKEGQINFDILVATPATMPKLLPFARLLGPKGLMPNPKNVTLTDKPEESVKKLSAAKTVIRTEKKAPVVHIVVGKVSQPTEELTKNINELVKVLKATKIKKLAICATMGPAVKIEIVR